MSWVLYCQPLARLKRSLLGEPSSFIWAKSENASVAVGYASRARRRRRRALSA